MKLEEEEKKAKAILKFLMISMLSESKRLEALQDVSRKRGVERTD